MMMEIEYEILLAKNDSSYRSTLPPIIDYPALHVTCQNVLLIDVPMEILL